MTLKEIQEKREELYRAMCEVQDVATRDNDGDFTSEQREQWDKLNAEYDDLGQQEQDARAKDEAKAERAARLAEIAEAQRATSTGHTPLQIAGTDQRQASVEEQPHAESRDAFKAYLRSGYGGLNAQQQRALQVDVDTQAGYLVAPEDFVTTLIQEVDNLVFLRGLATTYQVPTAESLGAPSLDTDADDTDWTGEITAVDEESSLAFGKRQLTPQPMSKMIKVSRPLLRRSRLNVEQIVRERMAYKVATVQENAFLNGSGANQPLGVFAASDVGIPTSRDVSTGNTQTAIKADNLLEVAYTLKPQYRQNARWIFHRDALKMIRKIKDGDGNYVWRAGFASDRPDTILDMPYIMSEYAPNTFTTGEYVGILGDFRNYWIADALSMQVQRLEELYAATNQIGFIVRAETDGMPVLSEAFVRVTLA